MHPFFVGKRDRRYRSHAAGVQPFVAFSYSFVVFSFGQNLVAFPVGQDKYGAFDAAQELFDDNCCRCISKHSAQHLFQLFLGFFKCRQNQYALSGAKTIRLQYVWSLQCFQKSQPFFQIAGGYAFVAGGRYMVPLHESFGKLFASFKYGTGF